MKKKSKIKSSNIYKFEYLKKNLDSRLEETLLKIVNIQSLKRRKKNI